jgi:hypothetical protein
LQAQEWDGILGKLIKGPEFISQINQRGFYLSPKGVSFKDYCKTRWGVTPTRNTAGLLSINFWHEQSKILREDQKYLVRTGEGTFAIFNELEFPRPYLMLDEHALVRNATRLAGETPPRYRDLQDVFESTPTEDATIEYLRFAGIYDRVIESVTGERHSYVGGIRGGTTVEFELYLRKKNGSTVRVDHHSGQAELDYSIWTSEDDGDSNSIFLIEAKKGEFGQGLDVGWHKFAYPAAKLMKYGSEKMKIYPVYLLRRADYVLLVVFPRLVFHMNTGIVLNDPVQLKSAKSFVIPMQAGINEF